MNIKAILFGSAAALAAVSGAQAADAIVAAAPEPAEYVRVCDAFGTGYFYIPGTETCLKISGYVRAQLEYSSVDGGRNWNARTRGLVTFAAKNDSELGTIGSTITLRAWQGGGTTSQGDRAGTTNDTNSVEIDEAFITVGGFQVGSFYNYFDTGLSGETDSLGSNRLNSIAYNYKSGAFFAGLAVDETKGLSATDSSISSTSAYVKSYNVDKNVGIEGQVGGTFGPVTTTLLGGYDFNTQNFAIRDITSVNVGPGVFSIAAIYSNGVGAYYDASKWSVAGEYAAKITDKLTLTPGVQYFGKTQVDSSGDYYGRNIVRAGLTVDYKLAAGLTTKVSAQYQNKNASGTNDVWTGFVRLQRSF
jgi:Porin subfamily